MSELNEACVTVLCHGDALPMRLIHDKLIVGDQLGSVPAETPAVPLQQDVASEQRRLRLKPETGIRNLDLDLRNPNDLARSHLLHRLSLLGIGWGKSSQAQRAKGTFHELWSVSWDPEFEITLIERGAWGNTLLSASSAYAMHCAEEAKDLAVLTSLIQSALLAELPGAASHAIRRLQDEAALTNDVSQLMAAIPSLASTMRYGSVRNIEAGMLEGIVRGLVARICAGLPVACLSLDDDAAGKMFDHVVKVNTGLANLQDSELNDQWRMTLRRLTLQDHLHGLLAGRCLYLLFAAGVASVEETAKHFSLALSSGADPAYSGAWCEGFLRGGGTLLVHDERMLQILDDWIVSLSPEHFVQQMAVLRRTFSTFHAPERRLIGDRIKQVGSIVSLNIRPESFDGSSVVRVMQKDALERLNLRQMLLEPEMLSAIEPDIHLVSTLLSLKNLLPAKSRETARIVVRKVVEDLEKRLASPLRQAVTGSLNRACRTRRPRHKEIDWNRTIRANLKHYQPEYKTVVPELRIGYGRRRNALRDVILCVDQSGSMAASVVYSGVFGAVLASIAAVRTKMVVFDTSVVDLSAVLSDPVEVLFGT